MINIQTTSDRAAISLSALCAFHCLILPLLAVLIPSFAALPLQDEAFHIWMVVAVVPISFFALTMGCKKHKNLSMLLIGAVGLIILSVAAFFAHDLLGEELEKVFTLVGALIIAIAHIWNYRLCQHQYLCTCHKQGDNGL